MILYRTTDGIFVERESRFYRVEVASLDLLVTRDDLHGFLASAVGEGKPAEQIDLSKLQAPIGNQEVWASGVTYYRSRNARMEESRSAGGGDFYDRVYSAERPELFFKAVAHKVAGPNANVRIRRDANWSVPEPELTLLVNPRAQIIGYTIGNDMSSRDIEGQNPLYLPQAKVYDQSCALGPGLLVQKEPLPSATRIKLDILRLGKCGVFCVCHPGRPETKS